MAPKDLIVCCVVLSAVIIFRADGSGTMYDPPNRAVMWKYGYDTPVNYDYMLLNCGGAQQLEDGPISCGLCGDPATGPTEHDAGGRYDKGIIGRYYPEGTKEIEIKVELLAFEKGFFEVRLCNADNHTVDRACFDENILPIKEGYVSGTPLRYYPTDAGDYRLTVAIPPRMTCNRCVIQWRYHTGNSWGTDPKTKQEGVGLGLQQEFYNCADIRIGGAIPISVMNNMFFSPDAAHRSTGSAIDTPSIRKKSISASVKQAKTDLTTSQSLSAGEAKSTDSNRLISRHITSAGQSAVEKFGLENLLAGLNVISSLKPGSTSTRQLPAGTFQPVDSSQTFLKSSLTSSMGSPDSQTVTTETDYSLNHAKTTAKDVNVDLGGSNTDDIIVRAGKTAVDLLKLSGSLGQLKQSDIQTIMTQTQGGLGATGFSVDTVGSQTFLNGVGTSQSTTEKDPSSTGLNVHKTRPTSIVSNTGLSSTSSNFVVDPTGMSTEKGHFVSSTTAKASGALKLNENAGLRTYLTTDKDTIGFDSSIDAVKSSYTGIGSGQAITELGIRAGQTQTQDSHFQKGKTTTRSSTTGKKYAVSTDFTTERFKSITSPSHTAASSKTNKDMSGSTTIGKQGVMSQNMHSSVQSSTSRYKLEDTSNMLQKTKSGLIHTDMLGHKETGVSSGIGQESANAMHAGVSDLIYKGAPALLQATVLGRMQNNANTKLQKDVSTPSHTDTLASLVHKDMFPHTVHKSLGPRDKVTLTSIENAASANLHGDISSPSFTRRSNLLQTDITVDPRHEKLSFSSESPSVFHHGGRGPEENDLSFKLSTMSSKQSTKGMTDPSLTDVTTSIHKGTSSVYHGDISGPAHEESSSPMHMPIDIQRNDAFGRSHETSSVFLGNGPISMSSEKTVKSFKSSTTSNLKDMFNPSVTAAIVSTQAETSSPSHSDIPVQEKKKMSSKMQLIDPILEDVTASIHKDMSGRILEDISGSTRKDTSGLLSLDLTGKVQTSTFGDMHKQTTTFLAPKQKQSTLMFGFENQTIQPISRDVGITIQDKKTAHSSIGLEAAPVPHESTFKKSDHMELSKQTSPGSVAGSVTNKQLFDSLVSSSSTVAQKSHLHSNVQTAFDISSQKSLETTPSNFMDVPHKKLIGKEMVFSKSTQPSTDWSTSSQLFGFQGKQNINTAASFIDISSERSPHSGSSFSTGSTQKMFSAASTPHFADISHKPVSESLIAPVLDVGREAFIKAATTPNFIDVSNKPATTSPLFKTQAAVEQSDIRSSPKTASVSASPTEHRDVVIVNLGDADHTAAIDTTSTTYIKRQGGSIIIDMGKHIETPSVDATISSNALKKRSRIIMNGAVDKTPDIVSIKTTSTANVIPHSTDFKTDLGATNVWFSSFQAVEPAKIKQASGFLPDKSVQMKSLKDISSRVEIQPKIVEKESGNNYLDETHFVDLKSSIETDSGIVTDFSPKVVGTLKTSSKQISRGQTVSTNKVEDSIIKEMHKTTDGNLSAHKDTASGNSIASAGMKRTDSILSTIIQTKAKDTIAGDTGAIRNGFIPAEFTGSVDNIRLSATDQKAIDDLSATQDVGTSKTTGEQILVTSEIKPADIQQLPSASVPIVDRGTPDMIVDLSSVGNNMLWQRAQALAGEQRTVPRRTPNVMSSTDIQKQLKRFNIGSVFTGSLSDMRMNPRRAPQTRPEPITIQREQIQLKRSNTDLRPISAAGMSDRQAERGFQQIRRGGGDVAQGGSVTLRQAPTVPQPVLASSATENARSPRPQLPSLPARSAGPTARSDETVSRTSMARSGNRRIPSGSQVRRSRGPLRPQPRPTNFQRVSRGRQRPFDQRMTGLGVAIASSRSRPVPSGSERMQPTSSRRQTFRGMQPSRGIVQTVEGSSAVRIRPSVPRSGRQEIIQQPRVAPSGPPSRSAPQTPIRVSSRTSATSRGRTSRGRNEPRVPSNISSRRQSSTRRQGDSRRSRTRASPRQFRGGQEIPLTRSMPTRSQFSGMDSSIFSSGFPGFDTSFSSAPFMSPFPSFETAGGGGPFPFGLSGPGFGDSFGPFSFSPFSPGGSMPFVL